MPAVKSPEHAALGRAIRKLRLDRGLSQEELAYRAGLHRNYVGGIERGEINTSFGVLVVLARALSVPLSDVVRLFEQGILIDGPTT